MRGFSSELLKSGSIYFVLQRCLIDVCYCTLTSNFVQHFFVTLTFVLVCNQVRQCKITFQILPEGLDFRLDPRASFKLSFASAEGPL